MGFFNKLWNWVRGKGYKDNEEIEEQLQQPREETQEIKIPEQTEQDTIQTEQTEEITQTPKETQTKRTEKTPQQEEYDKAIKNIESKPKRKEYEQKLDNEKIISGEIQTGFHDIGELRPQYEDLFTKKILQEQAIDKQILDVLIENRQKFKHRFQVQFEIEIDGQISSTMKIRGLLPEESQHLYSYLNLNQKVEYLSEILNHAQSSFESSFGSIGEGFTKPTKEEGRVTNIKITFDFA